MVCKYKLDINGLIYTFGNECIKNWDEISFALKRKDHGGCTQSFSSSFQFVGEAMNLLLKEYIGSYLNANAAISVYSIEENFNFKLLYSAQLDFGSLRMENGSLSLNSFDNSVANLLKSKENTQYEFPVAELKETQQLHYDRMLMKSRTEWVDGGNLDEADTSISYIELPAGEAQGTMGFPLAIKDSEISVRNKVVVEDVLDYEYSNARNGFIRATDSVSIDLCISFYAKSESHESYKRVWIYLDKYKKSAEESQRVKRLSYWPLNTGFTKIYYKGTVNLVKGEEIVLLIMKENRDPSKITIKDFQGVSTEFMARDVVEKVDVIKPVTLLNKLLLTMSDGVQLTGEIVPGDARLNDTLILAAEAVRGIEGAKIYTSYKKFCQWMSAVYGYVPVIDGNTIRFVHRDSLYTTAVAEAGSAIDDVSFAVDNSMIYSSVKVGYEKKDYDSVNGRDEFRWTNEFDTGISIKSSTLSLISPYRADAYGIEFLAVKRGEDTSDTDSDTDVFFVDAKLSGPSYVLDRTPQITGVISPDTMFNAAFSPRSIIKANERYLASSIGMLTFASSEGNSDISIDGVAETAQYILQNPLFSASVLKFKSASNIDAPEGSLIKVVDGHRVYEGYVDERSCKYGRYDGVQYKLLVKTII